MSSAARTLSEISEVNSTVHLSLDLVSAAKRNIRFLRAVGDSQWLHEKSAVVEAIRRYDELWMPLISDLTVGSCAPMVLPPFDVEWIWFCHTLNPISYRNYCETRFSKLIGKPLIFNEENEEYALMRCQEQWRKRYPTESFENEADSSLQPDPVVQNVHLFDLVQKQRLVCDKFQWPYMSELVYLIAARQRYKGFLYILLQRFSDGFGVSSRFVPAVDILLMWITHQSYPTVYAEDMKEMEAEILGRIAEVWDTAKEKEVEDTKKVWERTFDQPYEKAGGAIDFHGVPRVKPPAHWVVSDSDVNTKYKSLLPRFLLEVCVSAKFSTVKGTEDDLKRKFLRLRVVRCHRLLKIDKHISSFSMDSWKKHSQLYCEFGTKGLTLELHRHGGGCFKASNVENTASFLWNELLRAHSLTLERQINKQLRIVASITPPVQAPYLLKCVPDRVTDDSGAMVSDVILRMNNYRPQEGRWLSRTVLDHAGRECFVVRIRMGGGFWRRGGETPNAVKWEERIIEIRQGSWSYVAGSIGRAPEKVVGTATPKDAPENWEASWSFSTGDELLISCQSSSSSLPDLRFSLTNQTSPDSTTKLLKGRKMQYQVRKASASEDEANKEEQEQQEDGFVTLVRVTEDNPEGRATALLNWKLLIVEVLPEEDAVLAMLICISILKSVTEIRKEDIGNLLIRRRLREAKMGERDWDSVMIHSSSSSSSSPYVQPWYLNPKAVISSSEILTRQPGISANYSPAEGGDKLYKRGIIT
ncbi:hypothetical protein M5689_008692 [Euphorbia peplus]|nr:hypothetical protein M5689_008692 [Euphorbia peplus]